MPVSLVFVDTRLERNSFLNDELEGFASCEVEEDVEGGGGGLGFL